MTIDLSGKRLELLKEAVPNLSRVAILTDVTDPFGDRLVKAYQASGERLGLSLWPVVIKTPDDLEPAFSKIASVL
jgi:putative tryptophan/tyrosine transport system substrate-binding protein